MITRILTFLNINRTETGRLISMSSLLFLLMVGIIFGRSCRDAIFIKEAGYQNLPYMYILTALLMVITSGFYSRIVDKVSRYFFLITIISGSIFLIGFMRVLLHWDIAFRSYIIFGLTEVLLIIPVMHFWTYSNDVFNPREGKRLFPVMGSIGLLGTILGGIFTKLAAQNFGTANLLLVWIFILLLCFPITIVAQKKAVSFGIISHFTKKLHDHKTEQLNYFKSIKIILENPLIRVLAFLHIPMYIVVYIIDYQFFQNLNETISDQDQLAGFLGLFASVWSLSAMVFQFFITGRLLQRFGIGKVFLIHPASVTLGTIALAIRNFIPFPAGGVYGLKSLLSISSKYSHIAFKYSFGEPSSNLLYNSISREKRGQSRAFITSTIKPLCIALAGIVLVLFFDVLNINIKVLSIFILGLSILWYLLSRKIKPLYLNAMVNNLNSSSVELRDSAINALSNIKTSESKKLLLGAVESDNEIIAIYAIQLLKEILDEDSLKELITFIPHVKEPVKLEIIKIITTMPSDDIIATLIQLLEEQNPEIIAAVIKNLGIVGGPSELDLISNYIGYTDLNIRCEAIIAFIKVSNIDETKMDFLKLLYEMAHDESPLEKEKAAYIIRKVASEDFIPILLELAESNEERILFEVIRALGSIHNEKVLPILLYFLKNNSLVPYVIKALKNLEKLSVNFLHNMLVSDHISNDKKNDIINCLGYLGNPESISHIINQLNYSVTFIQYTAIKALSSIEELERKNYKDNKHTNFTENSKLILFNKFIQIVEEIKLDEQYLQLLDQFENKNVAILLQDALKRMARKRISMALLCLKLSTDPEAIEVAIHNLKSSDIRKRSEAIEIIEGTSDKVRDFTRLLEGTYSVGENILQKMSKEKILSALLEREERRDWFYICIIFVIGALKLKYFIPMLLENTGQKNTAIRCNANLSLQKLEHPDFINQKSKETDTMNLLMNTVLFLRSIPLFEEIDGRDLRWIGEIVEEVNFSEGEIVFREHDTGDALYIIMEGSVKILKGTENPILLTILQKGDFFGEIALLDQELRSATVQVNEDSKLLVIQTDQFRSLLLSKPQIAFAIFKTFSHRIRDLQGQLLECKVV